MEATAAPKSVKKLGVFSLTAVFVAYTCSVSSVPNGGIIGEGATFLTGVGGIILGWVIGSLVAGFASWIGYKTGQTKDVVWKSMFGRHGFRICSLIFGFCQAFWACYDFFNAGQAMYNLMPDSTALKNFGFCLAIVIILALTILGGVFGIGGVKWISTITIPIGLVLFIIMLVASLGRAGGMEGLLAYVPQEATIGVTTAAQMMVGMWMAGFVGMIDLTTEAKNTKSIVVASISGVAFIMLCYFVGQVGFIGTGMKSVADLCASLGGGIFLVGSLFVLIAQGNTTPAANLMYTNSFSEALRLPKKWLAIIVPIIAAIISFVIMYGAGVEMVSRITDTVSTLMAPLIGVMIAEFYIVSKTKLEMKPEAELPVVKPSALICLVIGVAVSFIFRLIPWIPVPAFLTIIIAGAAHVILRLVVKMK